MGKTIYPESVNITEVCPRDGFQSLSEFIPTEEKIKIVNDLILCGFKQIEISSFVHPKAIPQLKDATELLEGVNRVPDVKFRALVPNMKGMERAIEAKVDKVKLMLSATDSHSISNANCLTSEALEGFNPLLEQAANYDISVSGSISVAFGCPYEGEVPLERLNYIVREYSNQGICDISLADTTGMANPVKIKRVLQALNKEFPHMNFSLHLHNTRGMAFANVVAGIEEGVNEFDSSIAGLGGCPYAPNASGNIATEDVVHGLEEMGIRTNLNLDKIIDVAKKISQKFPRQTDSFILKAGKCSDLSIAPKKQEKME